jgi:DNA-binding transcriptional MerR regulator
VTIHWHGGFTSEHEIVRPVARFSQLRDSARLQERMVALRRQGCTIREVAARLQAEGFAPPQRGRFWPENIQKILSRHGLSKKALSQPLARHEWHVPDLARVLGVAGAKLRTWAKRGWIHARRTPHYRDWVLWADRQELRRLRQLKRHSKAGVFAHAVHLTTPKKRPAHSEENQGKAKKHSSREGNDVM